MILDGFGRQVPERLQETFACRSPMLLLVDQLETLRAQVKMLADGPGMQGIDVPAVFKHLSAACMEIRYGLPFCECDCSAFKPCERCSEKRWLTVKESLVPKPTSAEQ